MEERENSIVISITKSYTDDDSKDVSLTWAPEKEKQNLRKHGIDFSTAALVFGDRQRIDLYDQKHSKIEDRYIVIGRSEKIMFVVYTIRNDEIRLISARLASKTERGIYYAR